ncbi:hypothetical protein [Microbacterium sp. 10M-3C3]|jgi:hypothetical protein|uniref:hypothetical protein n=1 Tax=Microbacterium sp. 10M-3C3 TaxID=2483401 RepID=UPI000F639F03|nr:hypothetical protein [Microbacterium sp. 10M-3C3]
MRQLTYGATTMYVSDAVSEAVMQFAQAACDAGHGGTVSIHALTPTGHPMRVTMLLTPASSIVSETTESHFDVPADTDGVREIRERAAGLRSPVAQPLDDDEWEVPGEAF